MGETEIVRQLRLERKYTYAHSKGPNLSILMLYLVAFASLWLGYVVFIIPIYGYMGFKWAPNSIKLAEALLAIVFFALILPSRVKRPSDFFIHIHFLLPILPMLLLYWASDLPRAYMYFVLFCFAIVCHVRKFKLPKIKGDVIPSKLMMWVLLIIVAIYISSIIFYEGLRYFNLNLRKVYEYRTLSAQSLPGIYAYFSPMVSKVLLPFALLLAVYCRKWSIAGLAISGSVMMFALTAHKATLFYPFLILCIYYLLRFQRKQIQLLLVGYIFCIAAPLALFYVDNSNTFPGAMTFRRVNFIPAHINFSYYDFFSSHPHTFLSQSKLTFGSLQYPYDMDTSSLISYHYYNGDGTPGGANSSWLGSGYMNLGFAGMFFYALIIGILLGIVDTIAKKRDLSISVAILYTPLHALFLGTDLPTAMLTHGLLLALLLTWSCRLKGKVKSVPRNTIAKLFNVADHRNYNANN